MTRENLARMFRPAGFEQPEESRRNYTKPSPELQEAFKEWTDGLDEHIFLEYVNAEYERAVELIRPLGEISYKEANSLLIDFEPKKDSEKDAGLFVSACYNQSPESSIVFDFDCPNIRCIGYELSKGKFLVNTGSVNHMFGVGSEGVILNLGETGDFFGGQSVGIIINNGKSGNCAGGPFESGIAIFMKNPGNYSHVYSGLIIKPEAIEWIPELKQYIKDLSELSKGLDDEESAKRFLQRYGSEPKEKIGQEIKIILRDRGFEV